MAKDYSGKKIEKMIEEYCSKKRKMWLNIILRKRTNLKATKQHFLESGRLQKDAISEKVTQSPGNRVGTEFTRAK